MSVSLGLMNPKNVSNVGAVMRAAGCFCVDSVFYTGTRYDRARGFTTDTKNAASTISLQHVDSLSQLIDATCRIVCIEFVEGASSLTSYQHHEHAIYLFGPEDGSLSQDLIDSADDVLYVPTVGCMNLAASVNVVMYDRLAKSWDNDKIANDELIKDNRDCRNRLKIQV